MPSNPTDLYKPSVAELGKTMWARTLNADGRQGEFTTETLPNAETVQEFIDDAISTVEDAIGSEIDGKYLNSAKRAVKYNAAMCIELAFWPETTNDDQSSYKAYEKRYEDQLKKLDIAINRIEPGQRKITSSLVRTAVNLPGAGRLDPWMNGLIP